MTQVMTKTSFLCALFLSLMVSAYAATGFACTAAVFNSVATSGTGLKNCAVSWNMNDDDSKDSVYIQRGTFGAMTTLDFKEYKPGKSPYYFSSTKANSDGIFKVGTNLKSNCGFIDEAENFIRYLGRNESTVSAIRTRIINDYPNNLAIWGLLTKTEMLYSLNLLQLLG